MPNIEMTNMVMIQDISTGKVVMQDRVKSYKGITFPGGHLEPNESIYDSAVREIKEETGLNISDLKLCGFMHWFNNKTYDRYFIYFYKTHVYSGELLDSTDEGRVFWASLDEIDGMRLADDFKMFLSFFKDEKHYEAYCSWNEEMKEKGLPWQIIYT